MNDVFLALLFLGILSFFAWLFSGPERSKPPVSSKANRVPFFALCLVAAMALQTGCKTTDAGSAFSTARNTDTSKGALGVAAQFMPQWAGTINQARELIAGKNPDDGFDQNIEWYYDDERIFPEKLKWKHIKTKEGGIMDMPAPVAKSAADDPDAATRAKLAEDLGAIYDAAIISAEPVEAAK